MCDACRREWAKYVEMRDDVGAKPRKGTNGSETTLHGTPDAPAAPPKRSRDRAQDGKTQHLREAVALLAEAGATPATEGAERAASDPRASAVPVTTTADETNGTITAEVPEKRADAEGHAIQATPPSFIEQHAGADTERVRAPAAANSDTHAEPETHEVRPPTREPAVTDADRIHGPDDGELSIGPPSDAIPLDRDARDATAADAALLNESSASVQARPATLEHEATPEPRSVHPQDATPTLVPERSEISITENPDPLNDTGAGPDAPQPSARDRKRRARAERKAARREEKRRGRVENPTKLEPPRTEDPDIETEMPLISFHDEAAEDGSDHHDVEGEPPKPTRRFLCPECNTPNLTADLSDDVGVARCERCRYVATDLLALVPVKPVGLLELTLGTGVQAILRAVGFILVCAALLGLVFAGR